MKYYFLNRSSIKCFNKEYFINYMKENKLNEIEVFKAIQYKDNNAFWCKKVEQFGYKEDNNCGKICLAYFPRNEKNGCCKYYSNILYEFGDKIILKNI